MKGKFAWVAAGMENDLDGVGLFVTYKPMRPGPIRLRRSTGRYVWIDCPDRDILIQRERYYAHDPVGIGALNPESYDEYIHLDVNNAMTSRDIETEFVMINSTSVQGSGHRKFEDDRAKKHTKIIADSGGFQLYSGVEDFIDPKEVIDIQNKHADMGMVLDLPAPMDVDDELIKKLAWVQRKNTEVMIKHKRDDLSLINVIQGDIDPHHYSFYRDRVDRKEIDRVAFPISRKQNNPARGIRKLIDILTMPGRRYSHYHVLGVSDIVKVLPIAWMARSGVAPLITTDSSTHVRNGVNGRFILYYMVRSAVVKYFISRNETHPSRLTTLPCGCSVCSAIKYSDAIALLPGALLARVLTFHNLVEYQKYMSTIFQLACEAKTTTEFLKEIRWSIVKDRWNEAKLYLDMVDVGINDGIKAVDKKFHFQLHQGRNSAEGLFRSDSGYHSKEAQRRTWILSRIKLYEKFYGEKAK